VHSLLVGFGLGFFVALQLGPMSLFLIRSTLRGGWQVGLAIGAGIALIDAIYAALGAAGVAPLLLIGPVKVTLGMVGAVVLIALGVRTLWTAFRIRSGAEGASEVADPRTAFKLSLAGTASNPLTIASWAAVFAAASTAGAAGSPAALVIGVGLGSLTWGSILASGTAGARRAIGVRAMRAADAIAGVALIGFGGVLAWRASHDS
jgi:putative LysE/RhtB family amino acid efflux pump